MDESKHRYLITCAWPYANGSLHIGHVAALLPSDILARYYSLKGNDVLFVSGSDCHGTPISVKAEKEHTSPGDVAKKYHTEFLQNFQKLGFSFFDHGLYTSTVTETHKALVQRVVSTLFKKGFLERRTEVGVYCEKDKRFLPDRYVEGTCPVCGFDNARGDQCDSCGSLLDPKDLRKKRCKLCGSTPTEKETEHLFFVLTKLKSFLIEYAQQLHHFRKNTKVFTDNFISELRDRAITRDLDWGIPVPKEISGFEEKRIYVWFEAVCGYISASQEWAKSQNEVNSWKQFWDASARSYYVYGKDNIPFHTVLLPAILHAYDESLALPTFHIASEYIQLEGKKLSTSRNWAVWIPDLLASFTQTQIRCALIYLAPETHDTNFSWDDFYSLNNNSLVATVGNYFQRILALAQRLDITTCELIPETEYQNVFDDVSSFIESAQFRKALEAIFKFAQDGNRRLDTDKPWSLLKDHPADARKLLQSHISRCVQLSILLEPFIPEGALAVQALFGVESPMWQQYGKSVTCKVPEKPIFEKIEESAIQEQKTKLVQSS